MACQNSLGLPRPRVECQTERRIERHSHIKRTDPTSEIRLANRTTRNKCCQYRRSSKGPGRRARILANRQRPDHGHVVVIHRIGPSQLNVGYVDPPRASGPCQRQHAHEQGADLNLLEVANSLLQLSIRFTVLCEVPGRSEVFPHKLQRCRGPRSPFDIQFRRLRSKMASPDSRRLHAR